MKYINKIGFIFLSLAFFFAGNAYAQNSLNSMNLIIDKNIHKLNFKIHPDLIITKTQHFLVLGSQRFPLDLDDKILQENDFIDIETVFTKEISPKQLKSIYNEIFLEKLGNTNSAVIISKNKNGKIEFAGSPESG